MDIATPSLTKCGSEQTMDVARASWRRAQRKWGSIDERNPNLYLESVGTSDEEKALAAELASRPGLTIDAVVSVISW